MVRHSLHMIDPGSIPGIANSVLRMIKIEPRA